MVACAAQCTTLPHLPVENADHASMGCPMYNSISLISLGRMQTMLACAAQCTTRTHLQGENADHASMCCPIYNSDSSPGGECRPC